MWSLIVQTVKSGIYVIYSFVKMLSFRISLGLFNRLLVLVDTQWTILNTGFKFGAGFELMQLLDCGKREIYSTMNVPNLTV